MEQCIRRTGNDGDSTLCLICAVQWDSKKVLVIKREQVERESVLLEEDSDRGSVNSSRKWSEEEHLMFQWLSKWLNLSLSSIRWNSDAESFPICAQCKDQLRFLLDVRKRIEELEELLKNGVNQLRNKATASEGMVELSGVYARDHRYWRVRRQINQLKHEPNRESKDVLIPFVLLSTKDKVNAERFVKVEPDEADDDNGKVLRNSTSKTRRAGPGPMKVRKNPSKEAGQDEVKPARQKLANKTCDKRNRGRLNLKVNVDLDDGVDFEFHVGGGTGDNFNQEKSSRKRQRQKTKKSREDEDFVPPLPPGYVLEESDGDAILNAKVDDKDCNVRRSRKGMKKMKVDPVTGVVTVSDVQFEPLENDLYTCAICLKTVKRNPVYKTNTLRTHALRFHSNRFACSESECKFKAASTKDLNSHIKSIHQGLKGVSKYLGYVCPICGKNLHSKLRLEAHRWFHYSEEERLKALASGREKPGPEKIYAPDPRIQCEECGNMLKKSQMLYHKLRKHATEEEKTKATVLCSVCGKSTYYFDLSEHIRKRHPTSLYKCDQCSKVFKDNKKLARHKKTHLGLTFKCPICEKGFSNQHSLTGHVNLHNNIRPFECKECVVSFASKKTLLKHNSIYHREGRVPKRKAYVRGLGKNSRKEVKEKLYHQGPDAPFGLEMDAVGNEGLHLSLLRN